jgi:hypothetical protein
MLRYHSARQITLHSYFVILSEAKDPAKPASNSIYVSILPKEIAVGWIEGAFPEIHQNRPKQYGFQADHIHIVWPLLERDEDYSTVIKNDPGESNIGNLGSRDPFDHA